MSIRFSADEVLEIAQAIEANGTRFYQVAAESLGRGKPQDVLMELSRWEQVHERTFAQMRQALAKEERDSDVFDPDGEASLYLRALADAQVFKPTDDPAARIGPNPTYQGILQTAIGLEKESILFYVGMRDFVSQAGGKARIDAILREEMNHVTVLTRELAAAGKA